MYGYTILLAYCGAAGPTGAKWDTPEPKGEGENVKGSLVEEKLTSKQ
jgi:hypothetical protein